MALTRHPITDPHTDYAATKEDFTPALYRIAWRQAGGPVQHLDVEADSPKTALATLSEPRWAFAALKQHYREENTND